MEVKRQTCQSCNSIDVRNIIVRDGGRQVIYVRCAKCKDLVARYELNDYYHHGKGVESFLRAKGKAGSDSGRAWLDSFKTSQQEAQDGYEEALKVLEESNKDV